MEKDPATGRKTRKKNSPRKGLNFHYGVGADKIIVK